MLVKPAPARKGLVFGGAFASFITAGKHVDVSYDKLRLLRTVLTFLPLLDSMFRYFKKVSRFRPETRFNAQGEGSVGILRLEYSNCMCVNLMYVLKIDL